MARKRHLNGAGEGQLDLPAFAPVVTIPTIMVPQPNGDFLIKPGKPVVESDAVGTRKASRILGLSLRRVQTMCEEGLIESERPGGPRGHYRIKLADVMKRKDERE